MTFADFIAEHDALLIRRIGDVLLVRSVYTKRWPNGEVTSHYCVEAIQANWTAIKNWLGY